MDRSEARKLRAEIQDRYPGAIVEVIPDPDGVRLIIDVDKEPRCEHKTLHLSIGRSDSLLLSVLLPEQTDAADAEPS